MDSDVPLGLDRCLFPFDPRHVPVYRFDLVVIGSGLAGGAAALTAARAGLSVGLIAKASLGEGNTRYAQGGLAAVLAPEDSFEEHVADTLLVGCGLCERDAVELVVRGGPAAVEELVALGAEFDRGDGGEFELSREGGHSRARVTHAQGDSTGLEIQRSLAAAVAGNEHIITFPQTFAIDLLSDTHEGVAGVLCRTARGEHVAFGAANVLMATGGSGQIFRETTNPPVATGDGVAMAFRAGAEVRDLEFVQFHPTCLYIAGAARVLISEIVRGAGGVLRDRHGRRFMPGAHPDAELAPRDVVSRAVFTRMVETGDTNVYLDLSAIAGDPHVRFPGISRVCRVFGIDIARDPVPVRPGAHYQVGGVAVDLDGRTSLPGLWAVGECASSGLHGANRMGSNSLLEALVLGLRAGSALAGAGGEVGQPRSFGGAAPERRQRENLTQPVNIEDLVYSLKSMMWRQMGVARADSGMREAVEKLGFWSRVVADLAEPGPKSWELYNMLSVARLAAISALAREESRGVHFRSDFPASARDGDYHTRLAPVVQGARIDAVRIEREPVRRAQPAAS